MRGRTALATGATLAVVSATMWSLVLADRGATFSTAATVEGGTWLLVIPAILCLLASTGLALRPPGRRGPSVAFALVALAWLAGEWDNPVAGSDVAFSLGLLLYAAAPVAALHAGLSRTRGLLPTGVRAALLAIGVAVTVGVQGLAVALFFDPAAGGCLDCARNLWLVSGDARTTAATDRFGVQSGLVWTAVVVVVLGIAVVRASPAARRGTGPLLLATLAFEGVTLASYAHSWRRGFLGGDDLDQRLWSAQAVALGLMAAAAMAELVRERRSRRALARVVVDLSGVAVSTRTLRDALADRLDDPALVLAYPVDGGARHVDAVARPLSLEVRAGRELTRLEHGGQLLATVMHRTGALSGRDAADELVAAIHLGLDHERLRAQALAQVEDLRASGLRLVETGDAERRRLERDLHDGAQQRLVGLALGLRLRQARSGATPAVTEAMGELNDAIDDLRTLARGVSPVLLAQAGLQSGLRGLAESAPVRLVAVPDARFAPVVESTAYAVVDRAAARGPVDVDIRRDGDTLCVSVTAADGPPDLGDLGDRVTALGGAVQVSGTTVLVVLPV